MEFAVTKPSHTTMPGPVILLDSKKVLVTGGTGFVGAAIVRRLAEKYPRCSVTVIDLNPPRTHQSWSRSIEFLKVDVTKADEVLEAFKLTKPDIVLHTAGIVPPLADRFKRRMESTVWKVNVQGTLNLLDAAKKYGARAFVYTSSCCVTTDDMRFPYANISEEWPRSSTSLIYGESKVICQYSIHDCSFYAPFPSMNVNLLTKANCAGSGRGSCP